MSDDEARRRKKKALKKAMKKEKKHKEEVSQEGPAQGKRGRERAAATTYYEGCCSKGGRPPPRCQPSLVRPPASMRARRRAGGRSRQACGATHRKGEMRGVDGLGRGAAGRRRPGARRGVGGSVLPRGGAPDAGGRGLLRGLPPGRRGCFLPEGGALAAPGPGRVSKAGPDGGLAGARGAGAPEYSGAARRVDDCVVATVLGKHAFTLDAGVVSAPSFPDSAIG